MRLSDKKFIERSIERSTPTSAPRPQASELAALRGQFAPSRDIVASQTEEQYEPVAFQHPDDGRRVYGWLVAVDPSGDARVEIGDGEYALVPTTKLRRLGAKEDRETIQEQLRRCIGQVDLDAGGVRSDLYEAASPAMLSAEDANARLLSLRYLASSGVPTDDEVQAYVARSYPNALISEIDAQMPGRVGVAIHLADEKEAEMDAAHGGEVLEVLDPTDVLEEEDEEEEGEEEEDEEDEEEEEEEEEDLLVQEQSRARKLWASGLCGSRDNLVVFHDHLREDTAIRSAVRMAKYKYHIARLGNPNGDITQYPPLELAGGVRSPDGQVRWYDYDGNEVTPQKENEEGEEETKREAQWMEGDFAPATTAPATSAPTTISPGTGQTTVGPTTSVAPAEVGSQRANQPNVQEQQVPPGQYDFYRIGADLAKSGDRALITRVLTAYIKNGGGSFLAGTTAEFNTSTLLQAALPVVQRVDPKLFKDVVQGAGHRSVDLIRRSESKRASVFERTAADAKHLTDHGLPPTLATIFASMKMHKFARRGDYVVATVEWGPDVMEGRTKTAIKNSVISFVKAKAGVSAQGADFGVIGKVYVLDLDEKARTAHVQFASEHAGPAPTQVVD